MPFPDVARPGVARRVDIGFAPGTAVVVVPTRWPVAALPMRSLLVPSAVTSVVIGAAAPRAVPGVTPSVVVGTVTPRTGAIACVALATRPTVTVTALVAAGPGALAAVGPALIGALASITPIRVVTPGATRRSIPVRPAIVALVVAVAAIAVIRAPAPVGSGSVTVGRAAVALVGATTAVTVACLVATHVAACGPTVIALVPPALISATWSSAIGRAVPALVATR